MTNQNQKTSKNILRILFIVLAVIVVAVSMFFIVQQRIAEQIHEKKIMAFAYYDEIGEFGDYGASGLALVGKRKNIDDKNRYYYGFINERYEECIPCIYQRIEPFEGEQTIVEIEGKYALINRKGEIENFSKYKYIDSFYEFDGRWFARAKNNSGKYCLIRRDGSKVTSDVYDSMDPLNYPHKYQSSCFLEVTKDGKYGCIDLNPWGSERIPCEYKWLDFEDDGIIANKNGLYGLINYNGYTIIPFNYKYIEPAYDCFVAKDTDGYYILFSAYGNKRSKYDYYIDHYESSGYIYLYRSKNDYDKYDREGYFIETFK